MFATPSMWQAPEQVLAGGWRHAKVRNGPCAQGSLGCAEGETNTRGKERERKGQDESLVRLYTWVFYNPGVFCLHWGLGKPVLLEDFTGLVPIDTCRHKQALGVPSACQPNSLSQQQQHFLNPFKDQGARCFSNCRKGIQASTPTPGV